MRKNHLEATAYHEAGHAVAAYVFRVRFHYLTIKPDHEAGSAGHLRKVLNKNMAHWEMSDGWPQKYRARLERQAMISLAGAVGQDLIIGQPEWHLASGDLGAAFDSLSPLTAGEPDETAKYSEWLTARVRNILGAPLYRRAIEEVGHSLLVAETLKYRDARAIIEKAISDTLNFL